MTPSPNTPDSLSRPVSTDTRIETRKRVVVAPAPAAPAGLSLGIDDIYYVLFRHKWKVLICAVLGFAAAAAVYFLAKPPYQTNAKLFVRYVVTEGKAVRQTAEDTITKSPDMRGETIMQSEQEILTSLDLAKNVAQAVGPDKVLGKSGGDVDAAAVVIRNGLIVGVPKYSSVVSITFQHSDPEIARVVLRETIAQYLKMHVEVHRSGGMVNDFLAQETDQLRSRLAQTEEELRKAKAKAGVISVDDAKKSYSAQIDNLRQQIFAARAEQAQRTSLLKDLREKFNQAPRPEAAPVATVEAPAPVPSAATDEYRKVLVRLDFLRKREQELLTSFTADNPRVKELRTQADELERQKKELEEQHPALLVAVPPPAAGPAMVLAPSAAGRGESLDFEAAQLNALEARTRMLTTQMDTLKAEIASLDQLEGNIQELLRRRELEEANYRRYAASLEQSRINEAMGSGKVSNISIIQTPSPPSVDRKKTQKLAGGIAGAGLALGLAWAFLIELVLDRSIRRSRDVEKALKLPLFLSIPVQRERRKARKQRQRAGGTENLMLVSDRDSMQSERTGLNAYYETLRDRLIGYFESRNLTHKPKLVAVTGMSPHAGVTTMAAGLARCLSETGDGNVLLVDLTPGQGSAHYFHAGKPGCGLEQLLETRADAQVQDRLYVVSDGSRGDKLSRLLPQRFSKLLPQLKSSDFDYIIFDMPPVSQISITPRLAGFMDMVLLVIESEKNSRDGVQRAAELLSESNANVGAVLNKTKTYIPTWLHQELPV